LIAGPVADILIGQGLSNADAYRGSFIAAIILVAIGIVILMVSFRYTRNHDYSKEMEERFGVQR
jgi:putative Mn2+ efflux pump MntP